MSDEMINVRVPVKFTGFVDVQVPKDAENPTRLAELITMARIVATDEDSPSLEAEVFDDYAEEMNDADLAESNWDAAEIDGVCGTWDFDR